jgi:hypothetical protein
MRGSHEEFSGNAARHGMSRGVRGEYSGERRRYWMSVTWTPDCMMRCIKVFRVLIRVV